MVKDSLSPRTHRATSVTPHIWRPLLSAVVLLATLFYSASSFAQILGTAQLNTERRGHTATLLQNGKILIVGGENQSGIVSQAEILDPASLTSTLAPAAASPRADHTATLLPDGRVLISGGRDQISALDSTQIYDASVNSFSSGPSLKRARSGHSATALADGKILIVGGDAIGSAEAYDPATQIFSLVTGNLGIARNLHSAGLLNNGQVLIVGGVNAQKAILNSAEIYDPASQSFHVPTNALQIPRALATLRLLPDGKVQVIDGDSDFSMEIFDPQVGNFNGVAYLPPSPEFLGATLSTRSRAALVSPTASQNPNLLGTPLTPEQLDLLDRADQTITELPSQNKALVAGGVNSAGQVLKSASLVQSSPASVTTDKTDYAPGTIVTITGRGFQPNEDVAITLHERPDAYADPGFVATADEQGNFIFMQFAPQSIDIGRTFTLTAIGRSSGFTAQTAFTDATNINFATNGLPAGISVAVQYSGTNNGGNPTSGTITFNSPGPSTGGSGSVGAQAGSQFSYTFPTTLTSNGTAYTFVSGNPASTFTVPATDTTVTGTYTAPADLIITQTRTGNFTVGQTSATYTITAINNGTVSSTTALVTVADTLPTGLTATAISGTGWSYTLSPLQCTRSEALAGGASYPAITLTVNVASDAPASVTNTATVSGRGETNTANNTASNPTTINTPPDLTINKSHSGNFRIGQTGATYSIVVTNNGGTATSGTMTVTDTLPAGLTATAMTGTNWSCATLPATGPATLTCTRSTSLAAGSSSTITLTVTVANNAPASVTNSVTVSGGGEVNTANNSDSDPTTINHP